MQDRQDVWKEVTHDAVAFNSDQVPNGINLRRMVVVASGGLGKSRALQWIHYRLNRAQSLDPKAAAELTFHFEIRQFARKWLEFVAQSRPLDRLCNLLAHHMIARVEQQRQQDPTRIQQPDEGQLRDYIRSVIQRRQLCLILDGLDQVGDSEVEAVREVLEAADCNGGRFILAGRPSVVTSGRGERLGFLKAEVLGSGPAWGWVHIMELNRHQQMHFLGWLPDGSRRFDRIVPEARSILTVPRVLHFLRHRSGAELSRCRTAADVLSGALEFLLRDGLQKTHTGTTAAASHEPRHEQVQGLLGLLALAAWECVVRYQGTTGGTLQPAAGPNRPGVISRYHGAPSRPEDPPPQYASSPEFVGKFWSRQLPKCLK